MPLSFRAAFQVRRLWITSESPANAAGLRLARTYKRGVKSKAQEGSDFIRGDLT